MRHHQHAPALACAAGGAAAVAPAAATGDRDAPTPRPAPTADSIEVGNAMTNSSAITTPSTRIGFGSRQGLRHQRDQRLQARRSRRRDPPAWRIREHEAFGKQLLDDAPARGAERFAQGQLGASRLAAHQQQVRDVRARDQKHETNRSEQRDQDRPGVADHHIFERAHHRRHAARLVWREAFFVAARQRGQLGGGLLDADAGAHAGNQVHFLAGAKGERSAHRDRRGRSPRLDPARVVAVRGHHAGDRERQFIDGDAAADHRRRRAVTPSPQPFADHDDRLASWLIVRGRQGAADHRAGAQHVEEAAGDERAVDVAGGVRVDDRPLLDGMAADTADGLQQAARFTCRLDGIADKRKTRVAE